MDEAREVAACQIFESSEAGERAQEARSVAGDTKPPAQGAGERAGWLQRQLRQQRRKRLLGGRTRKKIAGTKEPCAVQGTGMLRANLDFNP